MFKNIDHIGIAVRDLESSKELFEKLTGHSIAHEESVPSEKVNTAFIQIGNTKLELLEPINGEGPMQGFIDKRGEGIQQMAFEVADIRAEMKRLKEAGFILLNDEPKRGANNTQVCFIHPKSANGILVELLQKG
ncbi:methylmalonyl-CoA epimerase [Cryomorphaceae bacterium]|nr:methylmalonyl-CoA epimerase [Cryomorphaceae bacterium]